MVVEGKWFLIKNLLSMLDERMLFRRARDIRNILVLNYGDVLNDDLSVRQKTLIRICSNIEDAYKSTTQIIKAVTSWLDEKNKNVFMSLMNSTLKLFMLELIEKITSDGELCIACKLEEKCDDCKFGRAAGYCYSKDSMFGKFYEKIDDKIVRTKRRIVRLLEKITIKEGNESEKK